RPRQVLEMIGVSRTTLWRMVQAGSFPRPVWITERNRGYLLESVEAWMKARAEGHSFDSDVARAGLANGRGAQAVVDGAPSRTSIGTVSEHVGLAARADIGDYTRCSSRILPPSVCGGRAHATKHLESNLLEQAAGVGGQDRAREERRRRARSGLQGVRDAGAGAVGVDCPGTD